MKPDEVFFFFKHSIWTCPCTQNYLNLYYSAVEFSILIGQNAGLYFYSSNLNRDLCDGVYKMYVIMWVVCLNLFQSFSSVMLSQSHRLKKSRDVFKITTVKSKTRTSQNPVKAKSIGGQGKSRSRPNESKTESKLRVKTTKSFCNLN